jgi:hypothetical protein
MAAAAHFASATTILTREELDAWIPAIYGGRGPVLGVVKVVANQPELQVPVREGAYIKSRFREALLGPKAFE